MPRQFNVIEIQRNLRGVFVSILRQFFADSEQWRRIWIPELNNFLYDEKNPEARLVHIFNSFPYEERRFPLLAVTQQAFKNKPLGFGQFSSEAIEMYKTDSTGIIGKDSSDLDLDVGDTISWKTKSERTWETKKGGYEVRYLIDLAADTAEDRLNLMDLVANSLGIWLDRREIARFQYDTQEKTTYSSDEKTGFYPAFFPYGIFYMSIWPNINFDNEAEVELDADRKIYASSISITCEGEWHLDQEIGFLVEDTDSEGFAQNDEMKNADPESAYIHDFPNEKDITYEQYKAIKTI